MRFSKRNCSRQFTKTHKCYYCFAVLFYLSLSAVSAQGITKTLNGNGNLSNVDIWVPKGVPTEEDNIIIPDSLELTIDQSSACASITFFGTGTLYLNNHTLNVNGSITANSNSDKDVIIKFSNPGVINCNSIVVGSSVILSNSHETKIICAAPNINVATDVILKASRYYAKVNSPTVNANAGTITINNSIVTVTNDPGTTEAKASFILGGSAPNLILNGQVPIKLATNGIQNEIKFNAANASVVYSGADQNIYPTDYYNLTVSGSGTKTFSSTTGIVGSLDLATSNIYNTKGSTINYKKTDGRQKIGTDIIYDNLQLTNTSGTDFVSGNLIVEGNFTSAGGTLNLQTFSFTAGTINNNGAIRTQCISASALPAYKSWNGAVQFDGVNMQTLPTGFYNNLILNNNAGVVMGGDVTAALTLTGKLYMNGYSLSLNRFTSTTNELFGSAASRLIVNCNAAPFNFAIGSQILNELTLSASASATLNSILYISGGTSTLTAGTLSIGSNATLNTNNQLTLGSNQYGTARVAPLDGTINGKVTVERYIPLNPNGRTGRAWRLLTSPVTATSINAAWQEGMYFDGTKHKLSSNNNIVQAVPAGYGTVITANGPGNFSVANANRFDYWDAVKNNSSSLRRYVSTDTGGTWNYGIPSTTVRIDSLPGYMLFVRGDRTKMLSTEGENTTTLRATGILRKGDFVVTVPPANTNLYTLVGNPYASSIDFEKIYKRIESVGIIKNCFWLWDANLNTFGGYRLVQRIDSTTYYTTPYNMDGGGAGTSYRYIESGAAFFVEPITGSTGTKAFTISETDKVPYVPPSSMFRVPMQQRTREAERSLHINLNAGSPSSYYLVDGVTFNIHPNYSSLEGSEDVPKPENFYEAFSIIRNGKSYMVEGRTPKTIDTIYLNLQNLTIRNYCFQFKAENFNAYTAYVHDSYTGQRTSINLSGGITFLDFVTNTDAASWAANRFFIVFTQTVNMPAAQFTELTATSINSAIAVDWKCSTDPLIEYYEVEHSTDGINFSIITKLTSQHSTTASYHILHQQPITGKNYYRIHSFALNGESSYSEIVDASIVGTESSITIFPNPVKGCMFTVHINNVPAGQYSLKVYNLNGHLIHHQNVHSIGNLFEVPVQLPLKLSKGQYHVQLTGNGMHWSKGIVLQ